MEQIKSYLHQESCLQISEVVVNPQKQPTHLIECILHLCSSQNVKSIQNYTVKQVYNSRFLIEILHKISSEYFSLEVSNSQMENILSQYFYHEYGYFIRSFLNEKEHQKRVIVLVIYACLYSAQKQMFVQKIMQLNSEVQEKIVDEVEKLEKELKKLRNYHELIENITKLQVENQHLKNQIDCFEEEKYQYEKQIYKLNQELQEVKSERNKLVIEKRKTLSQFTLSSLAEYEDLCKKLSYEVQNYQLKQQQLLKAIEILQNENKVLKQGLKNSDEMILTLDSTKNDFMKKYQELAHQLTIYQENSLNKEQDNSWNNQKGDEPTLDSSLKRQSTIMYFERKAPFAEEQLLFNTTKSSCFSTSMRRNSQNSVRHVFKETKNSLLLNEKIQNFEQQIQMLKLKIVQLEIELSKMAQKQKFNLKRNRKIQKLADEFLCQYQIIMGRDFNL